MVEKLSSGKKEVQRFKIVDPLSKSFAMLTPYQFASNTPIQAIDLDGKEGLFYNAAKAGLFGKTVQATITTGEKIAYSATVEPVKAGANILSTAYTGAKYTYATKLPEALGYDVEDQGLGRVLTTSGYEEFGSEGHQQVLKESAHTVKDEVVYGGAAAFVGPLVKPAVKPVFQFFKSEVAEEVVEQSIRVVDETINKIPEGKAANHIFSGKAGKFADTPNNRSILENLSNSKEALQGYDEYGKAWYSSTLPDGKQIYSYTKDGVIKGGGYNDEAVDLVQRYNLKTE